MKFLILLASLFTASYVSAHGNIASAKNAAGKNFTINRDPKSDNETPIRRALDQNPISDFQSNSLTCGTGAILGLRNLDVNPGEIVSVDWREANNGFWPHDTGPLLTYLADCGESCLTFQHDKNTKFFKIHELGENPDKPGTWFQGAMKDGGAVYSFIVPANLAPGNYLARSEMMALHLAPKTIEFYPGCVQLKVGGNEIGHFDQSEAVVFPGTYKSGDEGFRKTQPQNYPFPGGPIARIIEGGSPQEEPSSDSPSLADPPSNLTSTSSRRLSSTSSKRPSSTSSRRPSSTPKPSLSMSTGPPDDVGVDFSSTSLPRSSGSNPTNLPASDPTPTTTDIYDRRQLGHIMRRTHI